METITLLLALPIFWALLFSFFGESLARGSKVTGPVIAGSYWLLSAFLITSVVAGDSHYLNVVWVPSLGMDFNFRLESFHLWFAALICFIGGCIQLYATCYFAGKKELRRLLLYLQVFTLAMLGVVASENLYTLFLFWELTSVCSFLLVGLHHAVAENRRKAAQGLLVTMIGGIGLLVAAILLQIEYGTVVISELLAQPFEQSVLSTSAMCLLMLACLTKSAQFPFHFWLPNAMAGPTPVSAFLHSATMVKAGVFLLAVFAPWFGQHTWWTPILLTVSYMTLYVSYRMGSKQNDLKGVLASTTLAVLAFLTALAGVGTEEALKAFAMLLTAHALYKAPLFLAAGNIEKATGTRQLDQLGGVLKRVPVTGAVVAFSMLSLFGLPPMLGFIAKEYMLAALWDHSVAVGVLGALLAGCALAVGLRAFLKLALNSGNASQHQLYPVPKGMTLACLLPAAFSLVALLCYPLVNTSVFTKAAASLASAPVKPFSFWHGFTPALFLSMTAIAFSLVLVFIINKRGAIPRAWADGCFEASVKKAIKLGKCVSKWLVVGKLSTHLSVILVSVGALSFASLSFTDWPSDIDFRSGDSGAFWALAPLLMVAAFVAVKADKTITILVSLGFVGLFVAFIYLWFSSPDLALTQLLAETLVLFLITGSLVKRAPRVKQKRVKLRAAIAIASGVLVSLLVLKSQAVEWGDPASTFFLQNSLSKAFGANAVNVILVDFRAIDTFGEMTVLAIAALGVSSCLGAARYRAPLPKLLNSPWLLTSFPLLLAVLGPIILFTFWRGHNAPGGGFIAALMLSALVGVGLLIRHPLMHAENLRKASHRLLIAGLLMALLAAIAPLFVGKPLLAGLWWHSGDLHLGSPIIFDLGVFLTVIGFVINYLRHFLKPTNPYI